jgi:hypothetical protein
MLPEHTPGETSQSTTLDLFELLQQREPGDSAEPA